MELQLQALQNQAKHTSEYLTTTMGKLPRSNEIGPKQITYRQDSRDPCPLQFEEIMLIDEKAVTRPLATKGRKKGHVSVAYLEETHPTSTATLPLRAYRGEIKEYATSSMKYGIGP